MMAANYLSREEVRALDRSAIEEFGVPGVVLMENAGRGAAELLMSLGVRGSVAICCGKGNNGGDGFVIGRHLDNHHVPVRVFLFVRPEELAGDAAINYGIIAKSRLPIEICTDPQTIREQLAGELLNFEWIVDALFGTGLAGPVRSPFVEAIGAINAAGARVLAVDIPSGLDCDTGESLGATVRAEHTATFVSWKRGFVHEAAKPWLGRVHVIDIGIPRVLLPSMQ
jgi:NAD(P)H-hydrate epimerase